MIEKLRPRLSRLPGAGLLAGSGLLMISMTVVNLGNYIFNLLLGRWLGPETFADLSLIVTLLLMLGFVSVTFQLTAARFAAMRAAEDDAAGMAALRRWLGRWAWRLGLVLAGLLALGAPAWASFFHTRSAWPFVILALGLPVYMMQGVDRGLLQGQTRFGRLSATYQAEMWVRLVVALALVALGWGVNGAVFGLSLSLVATWWVARAVGRGMPAAVSLSAHKARAVRRYARPVALAHVSQILINNSDILIVKHFFAAEQAGLYAALALMGRIVFFATWSVVTALFPLAAQRQQRGEAHRWLLWAGLAVVGLGSALITFGAWAFPTPIVDILFGPAFLSVAPLLWQYAVATALYAMANVIITYRLSIGNGFGSWLGMAAGLAQVGLLWQLHGSLETVVHVQIAIMSALLVLALAWDFWANATSPKDPAPSHSSEPIEEGP